MGLSRGGVQAGSRLPQSALATPVRAYGIFPGGQSGNPASAHYDDMLESWRTGKLDELVFLQAADENHPRLQAAWRLEK